jgi:dTDP-4-dehydrorhamnose 3,5-epimerase
MSPRAWSREVQRVPFSFVRLSIPDVILVEAQAFADERGYFLETFQEEVFAEAGIGLRFVQDNHSHSRRGVLRGLHYQLPPHEQGKLVQVVRGEVLDVAVDLRQGSPTYGRWVAELLSSENHRQLWVPPGFAHGFCVLSEEADVVYKVTAPYAPAAERGILWSDPELAIAWPVPDPIVSPRDRGLPLFSQAEKNFSYRPTP